MVRAILYSRSSLHAQTPIHDLVGERIDFALGDQLAVVENRELVGHTSGEGQLLLDQQHGQAVLAVELFQRIADLGDDIRLDAPWQLQRLAENLGLQPA